MCIKNTAALRAAGQKMSNIIYAIHNGNQAALTPEYIKGMKGLYEEWDAASSKFLNLMKDRKARRNKKRAIKKKP